MEETLNFLLKHESSAGCGKIETTLRRVAESRGRNGKSRKMEAQKWLARHTDKGIGVNMASGWLPRSGERQAAKKAGKKDEAAPFRPDRGAYFS